MKSIHAHVCRPGTSVATEAVVERMKFPWKKISNQELTVKKAEQIVRRWQVCPWP